MDLLLVEDNDGDAELVRRALSSSNIVLTRESRIDSAAKRLGAERFDVVLLDLSLPDAHGLDGLARLRTLAPDAPIVVLTGLHEPTAGARALQFGAQDYVQKGVAGSEILRAVRYAFERAQYNVRVRLLSEAGAALGSSLETDDIVRALDAVMTRDYADHFDVRRAETTRRDETGPIAGGSLHTSRSELDAMSTTSLGSAITASFRVAGWPDGSLTLGRRAAAAPFGAADIPLVEELARRLGNALVHAGLVKNAERERERAELANRARDEFLAVLSHELRTPLNAILGWTQLLRNGQVTEAKQPRALETIERNARSQLILIEDVIDVSRITTGKLRMQMQRVDAGGSLQRAVEAVQPAATAKGITLHLEALSVTINADPDRLLQICWNLLNNAVKFTPRGGSVTATTRILASRLELVVRDTGTGMAADFVPHVFERFRQADASTSRAHAGLGLGLTITRHLVEAHGGSINAESEGPGKGSTFVVRMPISAVSSPTPESGIPAERPSAAAALSAPQDLKGLSILVVEDDADSREMLQVVLEGSGARVQTVASVAAAFVILEDTPPDLVISDIGIPDVTGHDLIARLRKLPTATSTLPVIALSAYAGVEDRATAISSGFDYYLTKPVVPSELLGTIIKLDRRFGRRL